MNLKPPLVRILSGEYKGQTKEVECIDYVSGDITFAKTGFIDVKLSVLIPFSEVELVEKLNTADSPQLESKPDQEKNKPKLHRGYPINGTTTCDELLVRLNAVLNKIKEINDVT